MAVVDLHLQKSDKTAWGFRLAGGADFDVPLTVIKVNEGSIAENAGMLSGDVVVRINDIALSDLTHSEAHDVIMDAGTDFIFAVRRGDLSHLPPRLLLYDTDTDDDQEKTKIESSNITAERTETDLNITDEEIANIIGEQVILTCQAKTQEESVEIIQETHHSKVSELIVSEESSQTQEKKWSTFLQKPKHPKPILKKESTAGNAAPYRVVIKKQPKKEERDRIAREQQLIRDNSNDAIEQENQEENRDDGEHVSGDEDKQELDDEGYTEIQEDVQEELEIREETDSLEVSEAHVEQMEEEEIRIQSESQKKLSMNLEEQLAQVQKQLMALSQLPSTIQQTLNAVTKQISELVSASQEVTVETKIRIEEEESIEEHYDHTESTECHEQALSVLEEESYEDEEVRHVTFEARNESEDEQALFEALERECEEHSEVESQIMTEEELEAHQVEQEKQEKKEKEDRRASWQSTSQPLTPLQRPIILPGGRKWSQPDDVVSSLRRPSMTDEKIANTINPFTEVVVGRTMGINFLKYQPPPKNLDYLQNSGVYKLIHDIEPPPKGIVARDIKVLAEQDYYSKKNEGSQEHPQMER